MAPSVLWVGPMRSPLLSVPALVALALLASQPAALAQRHPALRSSRARGAHAARRATLGALEVALRAHDAARLQPLVAPGANLWMPDALVPGDAWPGYLAEQPALFDEMLAALARGCVERRVPAGEADEPGRIVVCPGRRDRRTTGVRLTLTPTDDGSYRLVSIEHVLVRNPIGSARLIRDAAERRDLDALARMSQSTVTLDDGVFSATEAAARVAQRPSALAELATTIARGCATHQTNDPHADVPEHEVVCPRAALRAGYRGARVRLASDDATVWRLAAFERVPHE